MTTEASAQTSTVEKEDYELVDGSLIPLSSATLLHNLIKDSVFGKFSTKRNRMASFSPVLRYANFV